MDVQTLNYLDANSELFPPRLSHVFPRVEGLYWRGHTPVLQKAAVSIVGSRCMSPYGMACVHSIVPGLARAGLAVVSGLAYGVDAEAHKVTLAEGGQCVAVLGGGVDRIYPAIHRTLADKIVAKQGILVSEYPPGTVPFKGNFPKRNRIVAGLGQILLIVEAAEASGTMSTARAALESGREVCVIPADITRTNSAGVLKLLKQGAHPVTCAEDILAFYQLTLPTIVDQIKPALTGSPATLYAQISRGISQEDVLLAETGWDIKKLIPNLMVLELDGYIVNKGNQWLKIS